MNLLEDKLKKFIPFQVFILNILFECACVFSCVRQK